MWRLVRYLEENEKEITNFVDSVDRSDKDYVHGIAAMLKDIWPPGDKVTKMHYELGIAVMWALWLGRKAQLENDNKAGQFFREAIVQGFEAGKRSVVNRP